MQTVTEYEDLETGISQVLTVMEDEDSNQMSRKVKAKVGCDSDSNRPSSHQLLTQALGDLEPLTLVRKGLPSFSVRFELRAESMENCIERAPLCLQELLTVGWAL